VSGDALRRFWREIIRLKFDVPMGSITERLVVRRATSTKSDGWLGAIEGKGISLVIGQLQFTLYHKRAVFTATNINGAHQTDPHGCQQVTWQDVP